MRLKFPALATVFLLANGCAITVPDNAPADQHDNAAAAGAATSRGASGATMLQAQAASSGARTREEVHAEAVEAVKHHKSSLQEELDFFTH